MSTRLLVVPVLAAVGALALTGCGTGASTTGSGATSPSTTTTTTMSMPSASPSGMGMSMASGSPGGAAVSTPQVTATGSPATGAHNAADVTFAEDMIPHHLSAIQMAELARTRASNPTVKALAAAISAAQEPEVTTLAGWLAGWGQPVPGASTGAGTSGDTSGMAGMMSPAQMTGLADATGPAFDRMWTQMMTTHHQDAVTMARTELADGANPQARALARSIITSQTAQITQMRHLLTQLPG